MAASIFRFHPAAEVEINAAAHWYEERRSGLGRLFVDEFRRKVDDILESPARWPVFAGTRRALMRISRMQLSTES